MISDDEPKKSKKKKVKKLDVYACKHGKRSKSLVPYDQVCKKRYHESVVNYNKQFQSELQSLERMQPTAYDQLRFHRLFAITTLWPPLHTRKEIEYTINVLYKPSRRVEKHVDEAMKKKF